VYVVENEEICLTAPDFQGAKVGVFAEMSSLTQDVFVNSSERNRNS
jgi:hypothetical protein